MAEERKNQGNEEYKKKNYFQAIELYSEAISKFSFAIQYDILTLSILLRFFSFNLISDFSNFPSDLNPMAAYFGNRAAAYMMIFNYELALHDARKSTQLDPQFSKVCLRKPQSISKIFNFHFLVMFLCHIYHIS